MNMKSIRGQFPSQKMKSAVKFYSAIQRDLIFKLEHDQSVTAYRTRPFSIPLTQTEEHTPDFLVEHSEDSLLIDCHYAEHLQQKRLRDKTRVLNEWGRARAIHYQIVTDLDLWGDYFLLNVKQLYAYSCYAASEEDRVQVVRILEGDKSMSLGELQAELRIADIQHYRPLLFKMAWDHNIQLEMRNDAISPRTRVQLNT